MSYDRLKSHQQRMTDGGFQRLQFFASSQLVEYLLQHRLPGECRGRTVERLLLGVSEQRPDYWSASERSARKQRSVENKAKHAQAQAEKEIKRLAGISQ